MGPSAKYRAWSLVVIEAGSGRQARMVPMSAQDNRNPYQKGGLVVYQQSGLHGKRVLSQLFPYVIRIHLNRIAEWIQQPISRNRVRRGPEGGKAHCCSANSGFVPDKSHSHPPNLCNKQSDLVPDNSSPSAEEAGRWINIPQHPVYCWEKGGL
jgi:hypothetical protein